MIVLKMICMVVIGFSLGKLFPCNVLYPSLIGISLLSLFAIEIIITIRADRAIRNLGDTLFKLKGKDKC